MSTIQRFRFSHPGGAAQRRLAMAGALRVAPVDPAGSTNQRPVSRRADGERKTVQRFENSNFICRYLRRYNKLGSVISVLVVDIYEDTINSVSCLSHMQLLCMNIISVYLPYPT